MFIKLGEAYGIESIESTKDCSRLIDNNILERFKKNAEALKKIAPRADSFLYFSTVMMHAAESSAINDDGSCKIKKDGSPVVVGWDKRNNTWRWASNDPGIMPYKNANGDIFPEEELKRAHKKWIHKPLCIDHKSNSVDHTRGFIVDTYYDNKLKRVIALCALDKENYPDLARKVKSKMQTSVSMGTGVGTAICTDCAKVARVESDFCNHMKTKSSYGEINLDLSPIELSIVVTGADPKAHIKHIVASANTLNNYLDTKKEELEKIASWNKEELDEVDKKSCLSINNLNKFKKDLENILLQINELELESEKIEESIDDSMENNTSSLGLYESAIMDSPIDDMRISPPIGSFAASNDLLSELKQIKIAIDNKIDFMNKKLDNLLTETAINFSSTGEQSRFKLQEEKMSRMNKSAYYHGGGGVNEPSPGKRKYEVDPGQSVRKTDRHMVGQKPFPDTGDVDGMHPGVESSGMDELERKKMLSRAEEKERALRRALALSNAKRNLNKEAYYHGGGGVNEPSPGKRKYEVDPGQSARKTDRHMVGQKPFPDVGDVDGLHPSPDSVEESDELKRKKMLSRAAYSAKFIKAASLGNSRWDVLSGDTVVLSATVNELSSGNPGLLYDSIATEQYGRKLLAKVKTFGPENMSMILKTSQVQQPQAPQAPQEPQEPQEPMAAAMPQAPEEMGLEQEMSEDLGQESEEVLDDGQSGTPEEAVLSLSDQLRNLSDDLFQAVRALVGERPQMGALEDSVDSGQLQATSSLINLMNMRRDVNQSLVSEMTRVAESAKESHDEMKLLLDLKAKKIANASSKPILSSFAKDAVKDAKSVLADGLSLMMSFVKYANGTNDMLVKLAEDKFEDFSVSSSSEEKTDHLTRLPKMQDGFLEPEDDFKSRRGKYELDPSSSPDTQLADGHIVVDSTQAASDLSRQNPNAVVHVKSSSKKSRNELRKKLAQKLGLVDNGDLGVGGNMYKDDGELMDVRKMRSQPLLSASRDTINKGNSGNKTTLKVHTVEEMSESALNTLYSKSVRKEAAAIDQLIKEGKVEESELDSLVAEGVDQAAVDYWRQYLSQVDGGSEFASELVKDHTKAHDMHAEKVKISRAYELSYEMADKGLCHNDRASINSKADEILKYNDEAFESLKNIVANHQFQSVKTSLAMPQVGVLEEKSVKDDWSILAEALSNSKMSF